MITLFTTHRKPKPFVKWAGGKRQLVNALKKEIPKHFNRYIEPFVGGGALLFELMPQKAIINDINKELINAYLVIKENLGELLIELRNHKNEHIYYYKIRALKPEFLSEVKRASRFIYLNKTCFNGLYRENSKGEFNVPFGNYKNPKIVDKENLESISEYLNSADIEIYNTDYKEVCYRAGRGDFIYFDPPYHPISKTSSFTKYTKYDFSEKEQIELSEIFRELDNRGCYLMLSNSNTEFIKALYKNYRIKELEANRYISCKASGRKKSKIEILIKNF
ncbi:MAG: DNA adenine methylase [Geminocystis sp.]|nr:DNA adenine methylase [Geminocystis sp.]MCS7147883.1 DNA adenine methylase [Geminocystis sp.]MDW8117029.1 DNA adenine methylase [Geminocystis sp.]MDW8462431.1 DNA adenine methylase [Geminocystis sp.]